MTCESRSLNILNRSWTLLFILQVRDHPVYIAANWHRDRLRFWIQVPPLHSPDPLFFTFSLLLWFATSFPCKTPPHHKDHDFTSTFQCAGKPALGLCWRILHTVASLAMASRTRCIGIHNHNYDCHDDDDIISKWCWPLKMSRAEQGLELSIMIVMMI